MEKFDFKKEYKDLYMPKTEPSIVTVPEMKFIAVRGSGDPNTSAEYKQAMEILYGLSFTIKMSKMSGSRPDGYFEYVVPPLEGFWSVNDGISDGLNITDKSKFHWISVIRQPDFVTESVFEQARAEAEKKKKTDMSKAEFITVSEGLCVQSMHIGSYDSEPSTILKMREFAEKNGYSEDLSDTRLHHEIYLSDPRRCAPERLKTVIRHPIK